MSNTEALPPLPEAIESALAKLMEAQFRLGMAARHLSPRAIPPSAPQVLEASAAIIGVCNAVRAALAQPAADDRWNEGYKHGLWQGRNCAQPAASGQPVAWHMRVIGCDGSADWCELGAAPPDPVDGVEALPLVYATAQPAPARVPPGWVLVPVEPTIEMQIAGQEAWVQMNATRPALEDCMQATVAYAAMLAAATSAPQSHPQR